MTDPLRRPRLLSQRQTKRARLLMGCGSGAMALALLLGTSQQASAQGILAGADVIAGTAEVTNVDATTTRIDVFSPTAVINWTPQVDNSGNALDFLRTGSTAIFRAAQGDNFAVLNRILPTANNNIVVINGAVIGEVQNAQGQFVPGGFLAFYSPTGILVGTTATFDVGSLMLTTLDTAPASFDNFAAGGFLTLEGQQGSRARVQISPRARISALGENSFFAVVAAEVQMSGTARVNGSHAYIAGEVVNLRVSNGLFDISIPVGTASSGRVVTIDGSAGGPSSTGAGDNHMIYALARASQDPISMLFQGNLGFDPAQSAGVINGEIILAANYNVNGRIVDTGAIGDDFTNVQFRGIGATSAVRADITLRDVTASSSVLAIGTGQTVAFAQEGNSSFAGNLWLVGSLGAGLGAFGGNAMTVSGDVLVDARDFGVTSSSLQSLDAINATGGTAQILANGTGSSVTINGRATVTAEAFGGADDLNRIAGSATGGLAEIGINGGRVSIAGLTSVRATAFGTNIDSIRTGATMRGGDARVLVSGGGQATFGDNLFVLADANGADGDTGGPSTASDVFGGNARIAITGSGSIGVGGSAVVSANGFAFSSSSTTAEGAFADAGEAVVVVDGATSELAIDGELTLSALASGGANAAGRGGQALGGVALASTDNGGNLNVGGPFLARAGANGGSGVSGGDGSGGVAGAVARIGTITLGGDAFADASAEGGNAEFGLSGAGGTGFGGTALFRAEGTFNRIGRIAITGVASARADGQGGIGGRGDSAVTPGGRGGDGFGGDAATPSQAVDGFVGGAYLLASGQFGAISVGGEALAFAQGTGGRGGTGTAAEFAGQGGNGFGGTAEAGLRLLSQISGPNAGTADFGQLTVVADGYGGEGGIDETLDRAAGLGGNGTGGAATLTVEAGRITVDQATISATGAGGTGGIGGNALGGAAAIRGRSVGRLTASGLQLRAGASGGSAEIGRGGDATGGTAALEIDGIIVEVLGDLNSPGFVLVDANAVGGSPETGAGGNARGGTAYIANVTGISPGTLAVTGLTQVFASGEGGSSENASLGGIGQGGLAYIQSSGGSIITLAVAQAVASGVGGSTDTGVGGDGIGGIAELRSLGFGSRLTIQRNIFTDLQNSLGSGAILNADGIGSDTGGGLGPGGSGTGGRVALIANLGGTIELPNVFDVQLGDLPELRFLARGIGGGSSVNNGSGGIGRGGTALIEVEGFNSRLIIGRSQFNVFGQGGSSSAPAANITGGAAIGGTRIIRVLDEANVILEDVDGETGARGGNGSGTGVGGAAVSGRNLVQLDNATLNVIGTLGLRDTSRGGNGRIGGNVLVGNGEGGPLGEARFVVTDSEVTVFSNSVDPVGILFESVATGGTGTEQGGNAQSNPAFFNVLRSEFFGGFVQMLSDARGGNATGLNGIGGIGRAGNISIAIGDGSIINLTGESLFESSGSGGDGTFGGDGFGGDITAELTDSFLSTVDELRLSSLAFAGQGPNTQGVSGVGSATAGNVALRLIDSRLSASTVELEANASAASIDPEVAGGNATAGSTLLRLSRESQANLGQLQLQANAQTSFGERQEIIGIDLQGNPIIGTIFDFSGEAYGGVTQLRLDEDTVGGISSSGIVVESGGFGGGFEVAGRFLIEVLGGELSSIFFDARTTGFEQPADSLSQVIVRRGRLLADNAFFFTSGDIGLVVSDGGIIGSDGSDLTNNSLSVVSQGSIAVRNEGNTPQAPLGNGQGLANGGIGGRTLEFFAGNSIVVDGAIASSGGIINFVANNFGFSPSAAPPNAFTMTARSHIDAGTGDVNIRLVQTGLPTGPITLGNISAGQINVRNESTSDIRLREGTRLTASGAGRAIDLGALDGEVIDENVLVTGNPTSGFILTGGGHFGIYAASPEGSAVLGVENRNRRYNVASADAYAQIVVGSGANFAAYRIRPVLTVTEADIARLYGDANPTFGAIFSGFLAGDDVSFLTGSPLLTTSANQLSNVGTYAIELALGSLFSEQGYQIVVDPTTGGVGTLTVNPRPITVTADNLSRVYGDANPALTFTVAGFGLVNGDQLSGSLASLANATSNVGNFGITQGTLAASSNYVLTFVGGILSVTPRPITVTANSFSRIYGNANPALTFTVGGRGLVNGDQLTGNIATIAGLATGVGNYAITQGSLTAGQNYAVTFVNGTLTITPRPLTITADNQSKLLGQPDPVLTFRVSGDGLVNGDQLTGRLSRELGESIASFAITQGSLTAGANYIITFVGGTLTIDPPPAPDSINNPTIFERPVNPVKPRISAESEDEERYGVDFPDQPEAPLITEDPLLDDPVASGGDASVYGGTTTPPAPGGK